uniref:Pancreatic lipase-related protein 2-like n=1 Tax=Dermatophagoides pteronyssinus TaxID=6956 RepID=A0A6P6XKH8_DERPT|nr:pancreatic lipase-related protein 2-like [Dermatophagoides pteronyssinus]
MKSSAVVIAIFLICFGSRIIDSIDTVTYPGYGTFTSNDFKHPIYRPIVFVPESPDKIGPLFLLYTRQNNESQRLDLNDTRLQLEQAGFNPKNPTWILIHGFNFHSLKPWMNICKDRLLKSSDFNVILVDSRHSEKGVSYPRAVSNIRIVGIMIGKLIEQISQEFSNDNPGTFTLVGHSLGAHIAGYAGKYLNGTIDRIYGLDPAGPFFKNHPDHRSRLWHTDAQFVFNLHTNGGSIFKLSSGMMDTCGHVDLFMNNGHQQPGCPKEIQNDLTFNSCHHRRALWLMIEAITPDNDQQPKPIGYDCDSWQSFEQGECIRDCNADPFNCVRLDPLNDGRNQSIEKNLLLNSITTGRRYFMVTGNEEKFFRYQYLIKFNMKYGSNQFSGLDPVLRRITLRIRNPKNDRYEYIDLTDWSQPYVDIGKSYAISLYSTLEMMKNNLEIRWERFLWFKRQRMFINSITITSLSCKNCVWPTPTQIEMIPVSNGNDTTNNGIINDEWTTFRLI